MARSQCEPTLRPGTWIASEHQFPQQLRIPNSEFRIRSELRIPNSEFLQYPSLPTAPTAFPRCSRNTVTK
jgi:hypothetical protein